MSLTYEDAVAVINGVEDHPFALPEYVGGSDDLAALRSYVLGIVEDVYGVSAADFDTATEFSATILRDFLNRAIYFQPSMQSIQTVIANGDLEYPQFSDVASLLRYPAGDSCAGTAFQMYNIYRAFGYETAHVGALNGPAGLEKSPGAYTGGHAVTTVRLDDGQWVMEDAFTNTTIRDTDGNFLSLEEGRRLQASHPENLVVEGLESYLYLRLTGYVGPITPTDEAIVRDCLFTYQQVWFVSDPESPGPFVQQNMFWMYDPFTTARNSAQGGTFQDKAAAVAGILSAASEGGFDWEATAAELRAEHKYVAGFALTASDGTWVESQWITVQLSDFSYVSMNLATGQVLNGAFDQIVTEAAGKGPDLNPGDVSDFFLPIMYLDVDGNVGADWIANDAIDTRIDVVTDTSNAFVWDHRIAQFANDGRLAAQTFHYDAGGWFTVAYDLNGDEAWTTTQSRYNAAGQLEAQQVNHDAGGWSRLDFDVSNTAVWSETHSEYNSAGALLQKTFYYDVGGSLQWTYDVDQSQTWSQYVWRYGSSGQLEVQLYYFDNGTSLRTNWDNANTKPWIDEILRYNPAGQLDAVYYDFDAGGSQQTNYDVLNQFVWSSQVQNYDVHKHLTEQVFNYDVGGRLNVDYDPDNTQAWKQYSSRYDAHGIIQAEVIVYDDGHTVRHDYNDGILIV